MVVLVRCRNIGNFLGNLMASNPCKRRVMVRIELVSNSSMVYLLRVRRRQNRSSGLLTDRMAVKIGDTLCRLAKDG